MDGKCKWKETNNGEGWVTECGDSFFFDTYGPVENGFVFCPFCGNVIAIKAKGKRPSIPENWERFRQDDMGQWEFQFPGCENNAEWDLIDAIHDIAMRSATPESRLLFRDLCNAARCAWLDEAEREWCLKARPYYDNASHYHAACGDDTISYPKDIGISFDRDWCLAHAEAWAREGEQ